MRPGFKEEILRFHGFADGDTTWTAAGPGFGSRVPPDGARRRGRMFGPGELRLVLLKLVADAPRHGYELIKAIEQLTCGVYAPSPGVVYPTLQLLADEGAIDDRQDGASSRKAYAASAQGEEELVAREAEVRALMERLVGVAEDRQDAPNPQVHRALQNLHNALRLQRHRDPPKGDILHAIVDLIDETARRIERM